MSRLSDWRNLWRLHGGDWHGPRVETWTVPEDNFCAFMDAAVEAAVLAEREACALVADGFGDSAHIAHDMKQGVFLSDRDCKTRLPLPSARVG